ncbi:C-C chemokine receptor type 4-like [Tachysurus fulvidraco]|uniref:C-C chemokine receptor type 4-like n=1 Tax=Tachysurus fulvidraco TaxID=1234273 RepID=UPI001FED82BB|nr:C-C chemokine receptor type 4-like [Tachysurus fulvidraco]
MCVGLQLIVMHDFQQDKAPPHSSTFSYACSDLHNLTINSGVMTEVYNTTENYTEYDNLDKENMHQPCNNDNVRSFSRIFLPTLYSIVFVVGLIGNSLVMSVLVKYHKRSNVTNLCLFNLALSDLLFLLSLPFFAHYAAITEWVFGSFMCHAVTALYMLGFYGSVFFMILMTVHRYTITVHARNSHFSKQWSVRASLLLVLFMWTLSLGTSLPNIIFAQVKVAGKSNASTCKMEYHGAWRSFSYIELNVLGFIVPLSVMVFCYSHIIPVLKAMKTQKKHKAVRLIFVLVTVFLLFWTPYNIVIFLKLLQHLGYISTCKWDQDLTMAMQWVETIAYCHCCLNPIIYAFVGEQFRNSTLKILKQWFPHCFGRYSATVKQFSERKRFMSLRTLENSSSKIV